MSKFSKQAVDQHAKTYWSNYYKEFGKALTRDMPMKLKAAVEKHASLEKADGVILPRAAAKIGENIHLEGVYKCAEGDTMFMAVLTPEGAVSEVKTVAL